MISAIGVGCARLKGGEHSRGILPKEIFFVLQRLMGCVMV